ncbi:ATP-binding protein [Streptomyces sp. NPDC086783]|uniref:ATP-binding protein n=1 Tax=Streptomyces sp. NPDC086783 TaxID=3365758 RepID=UPI0037F512F7
MRAPSQARHWVQEVMAAWDIFGGLLDALLLVASELVSNAVVHALPPVVLHLEVTFVPAKHVQVRVTDGGPGPATPRVEEEHGRGNAIIAALADETGSRTDNEGLFSYWACLSV